jgi:predicted nucleic acid-binding protein
MSNILHIADADGLIAMINKKDTSHENAKKIIQLITEQDEKLFFPSTAITEAITTVQVRLQNPALARELAKKIGTLPIIAVDTKILEIAVDLYNPDGSKKNTMFDAVVAATAKKYGTQTIFSFDGWYRKIGFTLLIDTI